MVDPQHAGLSITRQCRLVSITRSSFYYASRGDSPLNLRLMRRIDEQFLETPFYGSRQMTRWLRRQGDMVSRKRVRRQRWTPSFGQVFVTAKVESRFMIQATLG